jgi:dCTP deaminase
MILPDKELKKLAGTVFPEDCYIGPSSVDLRLSNSFAVIEKDFDVIDLRNEVFYSNRRTNNFLLKPMQFCLASTKETIHLPPDLCGYVFGRSSIGRLGLQVQNAGFVDAGFHGQLTLELANQTNTPMVLTPDLRVCQLVLMMMTDKADAPYAGKYHKQSGATGSRIHEDYNGNSN